MSLYYTPNERIVDRAVAVWIALLEKPKYDNLGKNSGESPDSILANTMASMLASQCNRNNTPEVLTKFGVELKKLLMNETEYEYKSWKEGEPSTFHKMLPSHLSVDYHPDATLAMAAELVGLDMQFPWKTSMTLSETYLCVSCGYGAGYEYHYPLKDGRWLVGQLSGDDVSKIIDLVEEGTLNLDLTPNYAAWVPTA